MSVKNPAVKLSSDLHFCHLKAATERGFATTEEHDEAIVANWNAEVDPWDLVWILGDITVGKAELAWPYVDRLNGVKHLVCGNHDAPFQGNRDAHRHQAEWLQHFASVSMMARKRIEGHSVLMTHLPYLGYGDHTPGPERYREYRLTDLGGWLLCGHVHDHWKTKGNRVINVGLDVWDLKPVDITEIQKIIRMHDSREKAFREMVQLGEELGA